jgi:replication-associated recombination protein RarA
MEISIMILSAHYIKAFVEGNHVLYFWIVFIKHLNDSDPNAALYWLGRMLEAGEDPLYVARRLIRCASEDIGLADNSALPLVINQKKGGAMHDNNDDNIRQ